MSRTADFERGILFSVAWIMKAHGEDTIATGLLWESGADPKYTDEQDIKEINELLRSGAYKGKYKPIPASKGVKDNE